MTSIVNNSESRPTSDGADGPARRAARALRSPRFTVSQRHSRFVGTMKVLLPALAAALIGIVVVWPGAFDRDQMLQISFAALRRGEAEALTMERPRYQGMNADGLTLVEESTPTKSSPKMVASSASTLPLSSSTMTVKRRSFLALSSLATLPRHSA